MIIMTQNVSNIIVQRVTSQVFIKGSSKMLKITKNQLMILDAMMNQGGFTKKYEDKSKKLRYSEHIGMLDFNTYGLERIIVSTRPSIEYDDDPEILLPDNPPDALDYEYIFHTHPPTPFPGGRAKDNVLYEFPSINDLYHFAEHFNQGNTQGSIVIAPEGFYLISSSNKKINIPPFDETYKKMINEVFEIQLDAIEKYGIKYEKNPNLFYSKVAQDISYLKRFNKIIKKYWNNDINVLYKPRRKDKNGTWYIPSIYIPVNVIEPI